MKKILFGVLIFIVIAFAGIQIAQKVVMSGESYYVQITEDGKKQVDKADDGQEFISYSYELSGYDKAGNEKILEFDGQKARPLRKGAYLKVTWNKNKGVTSYEEVKPADVPKNIQEKLTKG